MQGLFLAELEIRLLRWEQNFSQSPNQNLEKKNNFFFFYVTDRKLLEQDYHAALVFVTDFL